MKLAVISDVHGNMPALHVVLEHIERWRPDKLIANGDLINRGPYSLQALQLLLERFPDALFLKGNHESFVLNCGTEQEPKSGAIYEMRRFSHWTYAQVAPEIDRIAAWDEGMDLDDLEGGSIHITHGTILGNRDGITPRTQDHELPEKIGSDKDIFITSHTHWPFIRKFNGTTVINSGSVGTPFDRDYRSSYAQMSYSSGSWQAEIIRLDYDRYQTEQDYVQSGFMDAGGPITKLMLMELRHARGFIGTWLRDYEAAIINGYLTLEDSIKIHLEKMLGS
jgi:putative phosphoesterase